jgi:hypothetical protein
MVFSKTVTSKPGMVLFALLAALMPAASPPIITKFIILSFSV